MNLLGYEQALRALAKVPSRASKAFASRLRREITKQFTGGVDPYGKPWAALAPATLAKGRQPPPLTDTGKMRRSLRVTPMQSAGVQITIGTDYAQFHQSGTSRMPARPFLPKHGLPVRWKELLKRSIEEAYRGK